MTENNRGMAGNGSERGPSGKGRGRRERGKDSPNKEAEDGVREFGVR
jgi:hypothetical protein